MPQQLDLFSPPADSGRQTSPTIEAARPPAEELTDEELVAALGDTSRQIVCAAAIEIGRRRPPGAAAVLEGVCRRFSGSGDDHAVPEQTAALDALAALGGPEVKDALVRLILRGVVRGPNRTKALGTAAELGCRLPAEAIEPLLQDPEPSLRAAACRLAQRWPALVPQLLPLVDDHRPEVRKAAACTLGQFAHPGALPVLVDLLESAPEPAVIEAAAAFADDKVAVRLGAIARNDPALRSDALDALEAMDTPRARTILDTLAAKDQARPSPM